MGEPVTGRCWSDRSGSACRCGRQRSGSDRATESGGAGSEGSAFGGVAGEVDGTAVGRGGTVEVADPDEELGAGGGQRLVALEPIVVVEGGQEGQAGVESPRSGLSPDADAVAGVPGGPTDGRAYISDEQIGLLDAPTLILMQTEYVEGEDEAIAAMEANPLWAELPAVQSGEVITVDRLGYPGISGRIRLVDVLVDALGG